MNVGDMVFVEYATGEIFTGEVVKVRAMPPSDGHETERVLFTVHDPVGFRSMYLDKCVSIQIWEAVK